jgi:hypothetical protein
MLPVTTTPSGAQLLEARNSFGDSHPELFFRNTEFTQQGVHLPESLLPNEAIATKRKQILPDVLNLAGWGVSPKLKDIIETCEPHVHQFYPVSVKSRTYPTATFFAMIVGHAASNQIETDQCDPSALRDDRGYFRIKVPMLGKHGQIAINRRSTQNRHLWFSTDIFDNLTCSDHLHSAIKQAGVACLEFIEIREV